MRVPYPHQHYLNCFGRCVVVSHCGLICISLMTMMLSTILCIYWFLCCCIFLTCLYRAFAHFILLVVCLAIIDLKEFLYSGYQSFVRYVVCKYFPHSVAYFVIFSTGSSTEQKYIILMKASLSVFFSFMDCPIAVKPKNALLSPKSRRFPMIF